MATGNAINADSAGLVRYDGAGTFTGVTTTQHDLLIGAASNGITNVAPSATSGVPVISQGASADPTFGTAVVAGGGTGVTSNTAYAVICGGTTSTGALQSIASVGTSGQVLTSNGASALPTFQASSGVGTWVLLSTQTASAAASVAFTSLISATYSNYAVIYKNVVAATNAVTFEMQVSTDNGSTYQTTSYKAEALFFNSGGVNQSGLTSGVILCPATFYGNTQVGCGILEICNVATTTTTQVSGNYQYPDSTGIVGGGVVAALCPTSLSINAIKFLMSSGNISGTFTLYGIVQ